MRAAPVVRRVLAAALAAAALAACSPGPGATPDAPGSTPSASDTPEASSTTPPPEVAASAEEPPTVTLAVVGDVMLGRGVAAAHADPTVTMRAMRPLLRRADITIGTLESTLSTDGSPTQGGDSFAADPGVLDGLAAAGFDALSLANNHVGDYGQRALLRTLEAFRGSGIARFGAGRDLAAATRPAVVERDGVRVGLLGFNAIGETPRATPTTPGALSVRMPPRTGPLQPADLRHVLAAVRRLDRRVDVVVVLPHWGTQYTHRPEPVQRLVGRRLVDAGADLVVGGHPHWVQSVERHRGATIAHSLGNFVFDMDFMEQTMEGVVLTATITGDRVVDVALAPYRMDATFTPRPLRGAAAREVLADVRSGG
ncbi:CapA family protein [Nocardioides sediminis]|uniref:CapA family protein n=1 Tax=Nocardioides sediminis TaxID=433648 RepID=UPI000D304394|nr:CapA family protein [Nocardioides sediminis]